MTNMRKLLNILTENEDGKYSAKFDPKRGVYDIVDTETGEVVERNAANSGGYAMSVASAWNKGVRKKEVEENADADDMYGDSSGLNTFGRQNGQEFTDRGRGNVRPRHGMDARFADNPMGDEQLDEFAPGLNDMGFTPNPQQLDQLHTELNHAGYSDQAIMQGFELTDEGKHKIAGIMGISPDEVEMLIASLIEDIRDKDAEETNAVLDDYYSFMGEGADAPMVVRALKSIPERRFIDADELENKKATKDRDVNRSKARKEKEKEPVDEKRFIEPEDIEDKAAEKGRDQKRQQARKEKQQVDEKAPPGKKAEHFITKNKADFKKRYGDRWEEALYATAWKQFGKKKKKKTSESTEVGKSHRPFKDGVMIERFSYERDALNNVTIRDSETGDEKFFQGAQATQLLAKLDHADATETQSLLAPLMEEAVMNSEGDNDFMAEIEATAGTYNFPWKYGSQHGLATAMYSTEDDQPILKLISVRDEQGDDVDVDSAMHKNLIKQAERFIPNA